MDFWDFMVLCDVYGLHGGDPGWDRSGPTGDFDDDGDVDFWDFMEFIDVYGTWRRYQSIRELGLCGTRIAPCDHNIDD